MLFPFSLSPFPYRFSFIIIIDYYLFAYYLILSLIYLLSYIIVDLLIILYYYLFTYYLILLLICLLYYIIIDFLITFFSGLAFSGFRKSQNSPFLHILYFTMRLILLSFQAGWGFLLRVDCYQNVYFFNSVWI